MPSPTLKAKATLNDSLFQRGLGKMLSGAKGFARGFGGIMKGAVKSVMSIWGGLAIALGATTFAGGVKGAYDLGGSLLDLQRQTGITVKSLAIMTQQFKDAGLEEGDLIAATARLQKKLGEAASGSKKAQSDFAGLGLSWQFLIKQRPQRQFEEVGYAIKGLESQTAKTLKAMDIFGRSGAKLLSVFEDLGGDSALMVNLEQQAGILERNAEIFDQVSDSLGRAGLRFRGFFLGVAETLAPSLLKVLQAFEYLDFSGFGNSVGKALGGAIEVLSRFFKNPGEYLQAWGGMLMATVAEVGNSLVNGFMRAGQALAGALKGPIDGLIGLIEKIAKSPLGGSLGLTDELIDGAKKVSGMLAMPADANKDWFNAAGKYITAREKLFKLENKEEVIAPKPTKEETRQHLKFQPATFIGSGGLAGTGGPNIMGMSKDKKLQSLESLRINAKTSTGIGKEAAYNQTPVLSFKERQKFMDSAVAEGEERTGSTAGAFNVVRRGDSKRRKQVEIERAKEKLGIDKTNSILEEIKTAVVPVMAK